MSETQFGPPGGIDNGLGQKSEAGVISEAERERRELMMLNVTEVIRNPDTSPALAREFLIQEVLFPSEEGKIEISRYEVTPTLREIRRRGGETEAARRYRKVLDEERGKMATGTGPDRAEILARTQVNTEQIIAKRKRGELFPEESEEWLKLHDEIDAAVTWHEVYLQREKAQSNIDTLAGDLFTSNFFINTAGTSSLIALLEQPEYGPAIEKALRAYIKIHLVNEGDEDSRPNEPILQKSRPPHESKREEARQVVRNEVGGDAFVAKRAEVLARHLSEVTLLSVWMSVPRDEKGNIRYLRKNRDGSQTVVSPGHGRLEGRNPNDAAKLVLFRLKYWAELNKGYPSIAGGLAKYVPEELTPTFLHFMVTKDGKSAFDEWYFGEGGKSLADVLKDIKITEDAFSGWVYFMWRQNNVRKHLLNFKRDGKVDCLMELASLASLRPMNKDFNLAISDPLLRSATKINMVACRLRAWRGKGEVGIERESTASKTSEGDSLRGLIKDNCIGCGFFSEGEWGLVEGVIRTGELATPETLAKTNPEVLGNRVDQLKKVTKKEISALVRETTALDKMSAEIAKRVEGKRQEKEREPTLREIKGIIAEASRGKYSS